MEQYETLLSLGAALVAGLLIGFEREQSAPEETRNSDKFLGGARTHPLVALLGGVFMLVSREAGPVVVLLGFVAIAAFLLVAYIDDLRRDRDRGLTSEVAFFFSYGLGALSLARNTFDGARSRVLTVLALAVVATLLLSIKPRLHAFVQRVSKEDVFATLKFLIVAVVVTPLLPDQPMGPLEALNPRTVAFMVVLISGISFVGYVAIRLLGARRGLGVTGLVGGLVSSTAVTLSMSERAKREPLFEASCALAIVAASTIMAGRVLLTTWVVNRDLVPLLAYPMGAMVLTGLLASAWFFRQSTTEKAEGKVEFSNPFELSSALKFAAVFAAVLLVSKVATTYFGTAATYATGVLAGLTDVDAITLSMAKLAGNGLDPTVAVTTILIGAGSNTFVKAGMSIALGGWAFGRKIALTFGAMLAAGAIALFLVA